MAVALERGANSLPVVVPPAEPLRHICKLRAIGYLAEKNGSIRKVDSDRIAVPMRPTSIGIIAFVDLNAALRIDEY